MRILKPEVAEERKRSLLQWVVHRFIKTSSPVSSKAIADEGRFNLSPATIRNVLKELEDEGYLFQAHTSAGRIPTDKGYRLYVDYLVEMQRLAVEERERIESDCQRRLAELDELLVHTCRTLSRLSHSAGFALSPRLGRHPVQRLELVPMGPRHVLAVLVTQSGMIRHWPLELPEPLGRERLALLGSFLSEQLKGLSIEDIQDSMAERIDAVQKEFKGFDAAARRILGQLASSAQPEELYLQGAASLASLPSSDPAEMRSVLSVIEDKGRLARILQEEFEEQLRLQTKALAAGRGGAAVQVRIGDENLPELRSLSLVTSTYEVQDRVVGMLGIMGPRHMEYPKMMALVKFVGTVVSETLSRWEGVYGDVGQEGR